MEPLRILLVDDHSLFRKGLAALMASHPGIQVVAEAGDGQEAQVKARETMPDIILMDVRMPKCDGLEATRLIKREMPRVRIIMLTASHDDHDLFTAIKNGAEGYLLKNLEPTQMFDLLQRIPGGELPLSGTIAAKILQEFREPHESAAHTELSSREIQVLEQVAKGDSNKEIATALCITENTVKMHLANILDKLHLQNRIQAAVYAVRHGLVEDAP